MTEPKKRGRPPGTGLAARVRAALLDDAQWDALVLAMYTRAAAGDTRAAKLFFERVAPPLRAQAKEVQIEMPANASLADQARVIVKAVTDGKLPADVGAELVRALGALASLEEHSEVKRRLDAMEAGSEFA